MKYAQIEKQTAQKIMQLRYYFPILYILYCRKFFFPDLI